LRRLWAGAWSSKRGSVGRRQARRGPNIVIISES
jgi:hypothetical protein